MTRWSHSAIFAGLLLLAASAPVHAQPKDDTATSEAKLRFSEGIKLADAGDHEAARLKFSQAWSLLKSPAVVFNLARSEQLSNHPVEALEHYRAFLKMGSDPKVTEAQRQRASQNIAELTQKVGQIDVEAPAGARVSIDNRPVEWTPNGEPFPVAPGKHVVDALVDGKNRSVTVECTPGTVTKAKLVEEPAAAAQPAPVAAPPKPVVVSEPPKEEGPGFWTTGRAVGAGLAGGGLLAVGAGVLFQLRAGSAGDEADRLRGTLSSTTACNVANASPPPECASLKSEHDKQVSSEVLRSAFFIGGGALVAGGVALFLLSPPVASKTAVRLVPWVSERDAGLRLLGLF